MWKINLTSWESELKVALHTEIFFTIDESEYDNSYFIALFIVKDKELIDTGYICLEDILGVFEINE